MGSEMGAESDSECLSHYANLGASGTFLTSGPPGPPEPREPRDLRDSRLLSYVTASSSRHNPVERIAILIFGSDLGARFDSKLQHIAVLGPNTALLWANSPTGWRTTNERRNETAAQGETGGREVGS